MLSQESRAFFMTTKAHLDSITGDELNDVFYRFDTAYVIFNRLYDEIPIALKNRGDVFDNSFSNQDSKKATILTIQYLGVQNILNSLEANNFENNIENFAILIENETFHITFDRNGIHDLQADLQLILDLRSNDINIKILALYVLLLRVRNNRQHARKQPLQHQRLLLNPLTYLLNLTNEMIFQNLNQ